VDYKDTAVSLTQAKPCSIPNVDFTPGAEPPPWYAAYTLPRHEKVVAQQLALRQVETFLPLYFSARQWAGRRVLVQLPLFPGYVFVRVSLSERMRVLEHQSVLRLVTFGGKPAPLPDGQIERLRAALELGTAEPFPFLLPGKRIRVKSGPLAGLEGKILRRKGRMRLVVSVEAIQRSIIFDLDASDLELAN
jgi:transcription termination/antitermination protein NusG